jgi:sugar/nucleoside kinase (ribokinase family)
MRPKIDIFGIGLANIDMVASFDDNNYAIDGVSYTIGEYNVLTRAKFKRLVSSIRNYQLYPGGSVANSIRNLSVIGLKTGFGGLIGDDE